MFITIGGIDPSLRNTGLAKAIYDTDTDKLLITKIRLIETEKASGKQVRVNSDDLRCSNEIMRGLHEWIADCHIVCAEIPSGGQSAAAAKGLGIATGILGSIAGVGPFKGQLIQVQPAEVKMAACGSKNASKEEMIEWATARWPEANWLRLGDKPAGRILGKNEHPADACGAIWAGIRTDQFRSIVAAIKLISSNQS